MPATPTLPTAFATGLFLVITTGLARAEDPLLTGLHTSLPPAAKPYVEYRSFVSPVTGDSFSFAVQSKSAPISSYDFDFCPHPPFNTLAFTLVTDPETGWTDYPETFSQPCPFTEEQLREVLGTPKFNRNPPDGLPWLDPYPWEQYENAALQARALKLPDIQVGNWYLQAAWAVRLDVIAGNNEFDEEVADLALRLPRPAAAAHELFLPYELQLAAFWEQERDSGVLTGVTEQESAVALAWIYRSRGELAAAERWLDETRAAGGEGWTGSSLYNFLRSSVELEQDYLRTAQEWLGKAWSSGAISAQQEGLVAFGLAEIARRLGDLPSARYWYGQARLTQRGGLDLAKMARLEQLANGRGY